MGETAREIRLRFPDREAFKTSDPAQKGSKGGTGKKIKSCMERFSGCEVGGRRERSAFSTIVVQGNGLAVSLGKKESLHVKNDPTCESRLRNRAANRREMCGVTVIGLGLFCLFLTAQQFHLRFPP